jgi:hypothetical protein
VVAAAMSAAAAAGRRVQAVCDAGGGSLEHSRRVVDCGSRDIDGGEEGDELGVQIVLRLAPNGEVSPADLDEGGGGAGSSAACGCVRRAALDPAPLRLPGMVVPRAAGI